MIVSRWGLASRWCLRWPGLRQLTTAAKLSIEKKKMTFSRKLLTGLLVAAPFASTYAYQTQDEWLPAAKVMTTDIIKELDIEETVAELTGMSMDPQLRNYLCAVFLYLDSSSKSHVTKQDIIDFIQEIQLPQDDEIINDFLADPDLVPAEAPKPRNYLSIGSCERYPSPAPEPPPPTLDAGKGSTADELVDLVIALRNKDGMVTDEELLRRLETHSQYHVIGFSDEFRQPSGRPPEFWPTDMLLTIPHHVLGATLTESDLDELEARNDAKERRRVEDDSVRQCDDDATMVELALTQLRKRITGMKMRGIDHDDEVSKLRLQGLMEEEAELARELQQLRPKKGWFS